MSGTLADRALQLINVASLVELCAFRSYNALFIGLDVYIISDDKHAAL
jgi:hypothetical protein